MVKEIISPCKIALVTDDTVNALYASVVEKSLESAGFKVVKFVFSHGEENKNLGVYGQI
jgi:3-dehydroquinate synthase